jgi:hypothetical protein
LAVVAADGAGVSVKAGFRVQGLGLENRGG